MKPPDLKIGDWVVVMSCSVVPLDIDAATWCGMPGFVTEIKGDRVIICSPIKQIVWSRPPVDWVPMCQLIKITKEEGERYIENVQETNTYEIIAVRHGRCDMELDERFKLIEKPKDFRHD